MAKPKVRTGMPSVQLNKGEFFARARARFYDPTFTTIAPEIEKLIEVAWKNYTEYHKSRAPAGPDAASVTLNLLCRLNGWKPAVPSNGRKNTRKIPEQTRVFCSSLAVLLLSEPRHGTGHDWMADIYQRWVAAHGIMILCPVNWYQAPSSLKLMIDRLVCADAATPTRRSPAAKIPSALKKRAQRMALPAPSRRPALFHRRARRRRRRGNPQANSHGLVDGHGPYCRRQRGLGRRLRWLLSPLCDQPRRSGSRQRFSPRSAQCRASASPRQAYGPMLRCANLARSKSKPAVASVVLVKSIQHSSDF